MPKGFIVKEVIDRPIEEVWSFLADFERMPSWMKGIESIGPADAGDVGEGTRVTFVSRGTERESTIVAWKPPNTLAMQSTQGGMTATYVYSCQAVDGGTEVTLDARCVARGIMWKAMSPLIGYLMKRADSPQIKSLKRELTT